MGESRPAKRVLAFAAAALLSGIAAPRVQAQESEWRRDWLEVAPSTPLTLRKGESRTYSIRLKKQPINLDRDGNFLNASDQIVELIEDAAPGDGWWVMIRVDGAVRIDGTYDADGDGTDDIRWVPSVGREFDSDNWNQWKEIRVYALTDLDTPVVFSHEVWSNDTYCPEHGAGPVTISITDDGGPINPQDDRGVTVSRDVVDRPRGRYHRKHLHRGARQRSDE